MMLLSMFLRKEIEGKGGAWWKTSFDSGSKSLSQNHKLKKQNLLASVFFTVDSYHDWI